MTGNLKHFFGIFKLSKKSSALLLFASLLLSGLQMLAAISIIPVVKWLDKDFSSDSRISDFAILAHEKFAQIFFTGYDLMSAVSFMLFTLAIFSIVGFYIESYSARVSEVIVRRLRIGTLDTLFHASWPYFLQNGSSDAVNHVVTECSKIAVGYRRVLNTCSNLVQSIALLIFSFFVSFEVTSIVFFSSVLVVLLFIPVLKLSKLRGEKNRVLIKHVTKTTMLSFDNIKSIKAMSLDDFSMMLSQSMKSLERNTYSLAVLSAFTNNFRIPLTVGLVVLSVGIMIKSGYELTAVLLPLLLVFERITKTIGLIQNNYQGFLKVLPFYIAFNDSMAMARKYKEEISANEIEGVKDIRFDSVYFSYGNSPLLTNINFSLATSSFNLIIGSSGSGKTTVIDLIMGLQTPDFGRIFINGKNLSLINAISYRAEIGFVPQEVFLLNDSLRDNVLVGRKGYTDNDIVDCLHLSGLSNLLGSLPNGLDSNLGESGRLLSGGQRQRVLIARALLTKPSVIVMDEPTSGLDSDSTHKTIALIQSLKKNGVLVIVVSHDKTMTQYADKVLDLRNGSIQ